LNNSNELQLTRTDRHKLVLGKEGDFGFLDQLLLLIFDQTARLDLATRERSQGRRAKSSVTITTPQLTRVKPMVSKSQIDAITPMD
jgi:hypothetical protein